MLLFTQLLEGFLLFLLCQDVGILGVTGLDVSAELFANISLLTGINAGSSLRVTELTFLDSLLFFGSVVAPEHNKDSCPLLHLSSRFVDMFRSVSVSAVSECVN